MVRTLAAVLALSLGAQTPEVGVADWDWLDRARPLAFDALMPLEGNPRQLAAYRFHRDLYQRVEERYFRISLSDRVDREEGEHIDATVYDDDNPIVRWASQTADALLRCALR
jgi:hypothetical protein